MTEQRSKGTAVERVFVIIILLIYNSNSGHKIKWMKLSFNQEQLFLARMFFHYRC